MSSIYLFFYIDGYCFIWYKFFVVKRTDGVLGAIIATLGIVLPSLIIIPIIAKCFEKYKKSKAVGGIMSGLKPAVVGMIRAAFIFVARTAFYPVSV